MKGLVHFNGTPAELRATNDPIVRQFLERTDAKKAKALSNEE